MKPKIIFLLFSLLHIADVKAQSVSITPQSTKVWAGETGAKFKKLPDGFLVELVSSVYDSYHPDFYRASGDQIYFFGGDRIVQSSMVEYPQGYKSVSGSLSPVGYLTMGDFGNSIALTLPHDKKLTFYSATVEVTEAVDLPESRFFDYTLRGSDQIVDFNDVFASGESNKIHVPTNHYFNSIHGSGDRLLVETWMNNKKTGEEYATYSHLLIYNKAAKKG